MVNIRVLVVDDAVVFRRLVSNVLEEDPEIEVVGAVPNGRLAMKKIPQVNPDLIVLDVEMPEMDGLETLAEIRKRNLDLPVIMFSTHTQRGASITLDALFLGATDYLTKPTRSANAEEGMNHIRTELIPKIKAICVGGRTTFKDVRNGARTIPSEPTPKKAKKPIKSVKHRKQHIPDEINLVSIVASTGAPNQSGRDIPVAVS